MAMEKLQHLSNFMPMNAAHLHLVINHIPVLGTVFGLVLMALGLARKSEELKKIALGTFVAVALAAVITYLTGEPAEVVVKKVPGLADGNFESHEDMAGAAMAASAVIGAAALVGLVVFHGRRPMNKWFANLVLLGALVVTGLMSYTAYLGGQIRHTETQQVVATGDLQSVALQ